MKRALSALLPCLGLLLAASPAAALAPEARGSAMASAYAPLSGGAEGLWYNPATLGVPLMGSVMGGLGIEAGNNALTMTQMRAVLIGTDADKAAAADAIDKAGKWDARLESVGGGAVEVMGVGLSYGRHVAWTAEDVSPLLARAVLVGSATLAPNTTYSLKGKTSFADYAEIALGYAHGLPSLIPGTSLSAGGALRLLKGTNYETYQIDNTFTTGPTPPAFKGSSYYTSTSGSGFGFDLGVEASLLGTVKASLVARNLGAKISWKDGTLQATDPSTFTTVTTTNQKQDQTLPSTITLAGSASIPVVGTSVAAALEQQTGPSQTRLRLGAEQSIFGVLSFRGGYVTAAGAQPSLVTFGLGIGAIVARVDAGAAVSPGNKGGGLYLSGTVKI